MHHAVALIFNQYYVIIEQTFNIKFSLLGNNAFVCLKAFNDSFIVILEHGW